MRKVSGWLAAAAMALTVGGSVLAQQVREREPAVRPGAAAAPGEAAPARPGANVAVSPADKELAAVMLACCRNGVEIAKLGQQKATSDEVKQFAEKMAAEHTESCAKLEKWAGNLAARPAPGARTLPARDTDAVPDAAPRAAAPDADRDIEVRVQPGARPGADVSVRGGARGDLNWVSIHQEIAAQCLASAKKELGQKEGAEFDKCFMGFALASHQGAIDAETVFQKHASPQFQSEIQDCIKKETTHLQEAKTVMQSLDGAAPRTARKPE
jgi:predicted outer membrane protein